MKRQSLPRRGWKKLKTQLCRVWKKAKTPAFLRKTAGVLVYLIIRLCVLLVIELHSH